MLRGKMEPDPEITARHLAEKLKKLLDKSKPEIVTFKAQKTKPRFRPDDLVKVVTAEDAGVCQLCEDLAAGSPYTYQTARSQVPHHFGCRCRIERLQIGDPGFFTKSPIKVVKKAVRREIRNSVKRTIKKVAHQRVLTIKKLKKAGKRFVAPGGSRAARVRKRK